MGVISWHEFRLIERQRLPNALNLFTNYVNIALDLPVDFPSVKFSRAA